MIFNDANFDFILQNLIRVGIVSSINEKDATARVIFEENSISYDLPMLQHNTLKIKIIYFLMLENRLCAYSSLTLYIMVLY